MINDQFILKTDPLNLSIHIEPTFVALTQNYLAVGFNNRAWFYSLQNECKYFCLVLRSYPYTKINNFKNLILKQTMKKIRRT